MTDQRMPGEKGVWLLERARQLRPRIIRILATAYADMDAAIAAVNTGAIYKYVTKPWDPPQLETTLKRGLEFFMVQRERDQLLQEKMSVLHNMMIADRIVSLGLAGRRPQPPHPQFAWWRSKPSWTWPPPNWRRRRWTWTGLRNPDFWKEYYQNVQGPDREDQQPAQGSLDRLGKAVVQRLPTQVRLHAVVADAWSTPMQPELCRQEDPRGEQHSGSLCRS